MSWSVVLIASLGCYALKAAGAFAPRRLLDHPVTQRIAPYLPIALLIALITVSTFDDKRRLVIDARLAGLAVGLIGAIRRLPFLPVVVAAAAATALIRAL